jgi:predicted DNA-binding mobile mystery protein A
MNTPLKQLKRAQIDTLLGPFRALPQAAAPRGGWIRAVREGLGMSATQLAAKLGVIRQSVEAYERSEAAGKITLESLNKVAEALECRLVYALVPVKPLEQMQRDRAKKLADALLTPVAHTMKLEDQAMSEQEAKRQRKSLVKQLLLENPKKLWD